MLTLRWWNLGQTFTLSDHAHEEMAWFPADPLDGKAALWDSDGEALTLSGFEPLDFLVDLDAVPTQNFLRQPSNAHDDRWERSAFGEALLTRLRDAGRVLLAPTVWTRQTEGIMAVMRAEGIDAHSEVAASHGQIFYWNTRIGMRDLLMATPSVRPALAPSLVCHNKRQVVAALQRFRARSVLVKSNFSLGGYGAILVSPGDSPSNAALLDQLFSAQSGGEGAKKMFPWASEDEPFLIENVIGDPLTNRSVTLDARISAQGGVEIIGVSEQVIEKFHHYSGVCALPKEVAVKSDARIAYLAKAVGQALSSRGYRGYFNTDFVLAHDGQIWLVDLNVRRSAPLDVHMLLRRLGTKGIAPRGYHYAEAVPTSAETVSQVFERLRNLGTLFNKDKGVLPVRAVVKDGEGGVTVPILACAQEQGATFELMRDAYRALA